MGKKLLVMLLVLGVFAGVTHAAIITQVVRANGQSGNRTPIGVFDGNTQPLPMPAGGLKDGNGVFSDRDYPWAGVPAELIGAEYVRTFNTDKAASETDVTYTITTSMAAIVAITIDDRIPGTWNGNGTIMSQQAAADAVTAAFAPPGTFTDTGLDVFIRESATMDRPMSIFAAQLPAGTYTFGAMPSNLNFYTIGAIPEPATIALLGVGGLFLLGRKRG